MRKILSTLTVLAVMITMVFAMSTEVAAASGNLIGPETVEKGTTFTVSYSIDIIGCQGINANYSYNSSELTLNSITSKNGANVDYANGTLFFETVSAPTTEAGILLNFSFTAVGEKGTKAAFGLTGISITDIDYNEVPMSNADYKVEISESTTYPEPPAAPSSQPQTPAQEPGESKPASTPKTPASTVKDSSKKSTTSSVSSVVSETVSSDVVSEPTSPTEDTSSEIKSTETKKDREDTPEKNDKTWIIVVISGFVLCCAIGLLLYFKTKKN